MQDSGEDGREKARSHMRPRSAMTITCIPTFVGCIDLIPC